MTLRNLGLSGYFPPHCCRNVTKRVKLAETARFRPAFPGNAMFLVWRMAKSRLFCGIFEVAFLEVAALWALPDRASAKTLLHRF